MTTLGDTSPVRAKAGEYLDFAEKLIGLFDPDDPRRPGWERTLSQARARLADPHHYLAVIGEFSSGKSTFVNALLQAELFAASVLRTTGAAVRVSHGRDFRVRAVFHDGTEWVGSRRVVDGAATSGPLRPVRPPGGGQVPDAALTPDQVRARLDGLDLLAALTVLSTDPAAAPAVRQLEVRYPSPLLRTGLVLIDTPGANSVDEGPGTEHARIAADAAGAADAAVVVMTRGQVQSQSLNAFLADALDEGMLARTVFVITRADEADEADGTDETGEADGAGRDAVHERFRADATARIAALTGLTDPPVVLASPRQVVAGLRTAGGGPQDLTEADDWSKRFDLTRAWLLRIVETRRAAAVDDTVLRLVQDLQQGLDEGLTGEIRDLELRRRELEAVAPADMSGFLADRVTAGGAALQTVWQGVLTTVRNRRAYREEEATDEVASALAGCANGRQIEEALSGPVPARVRQCVDRFLADAATETRTRFGDRLESLSADLLDDFREAFSRLDRIDAAPLRGHGTGAEAGTVAVGAGSFASAAALASDDSRRDRISVGWGAGTGATVGMMVGGPLGALFGAGLGFIFGSLFTRDIAAVRRQAQEKADASVSQLFDAALRAAEAAIAEARAAAVAELSRQADWYRDAYRQAVDVLHQAHAAERDALAARGAELQAAVGQISAYAEAVAAERARLRVVGPLHTTDPFGGFHE